VGSLAGKADVQNLSVNFRLRPITDNSIHLVAGILIRLHALVWFVRDLKVSYRKHPVKFNLAIAP
jgi:hypothetical protein